MPSPRTNPLNFVIALSFLVLSLSSAHATDPSFQKDPAPNLPPVPSLASALSKAWDFANTYGILVPDQASITYVDSEKPAYRVIELMVKTQAYEGGDPNLFGSGSGVYRDFDERRSVKKTGGDFQVLPFWFIFKLDVNQPNRIDLSRIEGALFKGTGRWSGGSGVANVIKVGFENLSSTNTLIGGLDYISADVNQVFDITESGSLRLFLRGKLGLSMYAKAPVSELKTSRMIEDFSAALGEIGLVIAKKYALKVRAQLSLVQFEPVPIYGAKLEYEFAESWKAYAGITVLDFSNISNKTADDKETTVIRGTAGVAYEF